MLKGTKSMNLSYSSIIDGNSVVYMTAQVRKPEEATAQRPYRIRKCMKRIKRECRKDYGCI